MTPTNCARFKWSHYPFCNSCVYKRAYQRVLRLRKTILETFGARCQLCGKTGSGKTGTRLFFAHRYYAPDSVIPFKNGKKSSSTTALLYEVMKVPRRFYLLCNICHMAFDKARATRGIDIVKPFLLQTIPNRSILREARFWSKVEKGPECWEWKGNRTPSRYGTFHIGGRQDGENVAAHRMAFELRVGPVPKKRWVLHNKKQSQYGGVGPKAVVEFREK